MSRSADELLYDSEAALRLVATALHELRGDGRETLGAAAGVAEPVGFRDMVSHASVDIGKLLAALRECRAILEAHPQLLPISAAALHHHFDVAHRAHVGERVAAHGDHVGEHSDT